MHISKIISTFASDFDKGDIRWYQTLKCMSFLALYFIGFFLMLAIAVVYWLRKGDIKLSDIIVLPIVGMLSLGGIAVLIVILLCKGIELLLDESGKNKIFWTR